MTKTHTGYGGSPTKVPLRKVWTLIQPENYFTGKVVATLVCEEHFGDKSTRKINRGLLHLEDDEEFHYLKRRIEGIQESEE